MSEYDVYLMAPDSDTMLDHFDSGYSADAAATGRARIAFGALEYTNVMCDVGSFTITLPYPQFDMEKARLDARLVVWRKPPGGHKYLDFAGLVRSSPRPELYQRGNEMYCLLRGYSYNHLLKRRVIEGFATSPEASKSGAAESVMKEYVDEAMGPSAAAARDISAWGFTIQNDDGLGTAIDKAASYKNLLDTLKDISGDSHSTPSTATYFGIVPTGSGWPMEFQTRLEMLGNDHRHPSGPSGVTGAQGPVVISLDRQNVDNVILIHSRMDEYNFVYGLGPGEGYERNIQTATSGVWSGASPLNRIEQTVNASNCGTNAEVTAMATAKLWDGRPRRSFSASIVDAPGTIYGLHYGFGDYLTASIMGYVFDCRVEAVTVRVADRDETITAQIKSED